MKPNLNCFALFERKFGALFGREVIAVAKQNRVVGLVFVQAANRANLGRR
jgi:hypothetical protein